MRELLERLLRSVGAPNPDRAETLWAEYRAGGAGADAAFATLLAWYGAPIYRRIWGFVRSDAADDIFQDVVAKLHLQRQKLISLEHALRWLRKAAVTQCVDAHRRQVRRKARDHSAARPESEPPPGSADELQEVLRVALGKLTEREQQAVALVYFEGLIKQDAAKALGMHRDTFTRLLDRALARLRSALATTTVLGTAATTATLEAALRNLPPTPTRLANLAARAWDQALGAVRPVVGGSLLPGKIQLLAGVVLGGLVAVSLAITLRRPDMPGAPAKNTARLGVERLEARDVPTGGFLDTTFSGDGIAPYGGRDLAVQADGKILTISTASAGSQGSNLIVTRVKTDGTLDTSFGSGGKVSVDFSRLSDSGYAIAVLPNGKILAAGLAEVKVGGSTYRQNGLVRLNPNGQLDTTFGAGGKVVTAGTGGVFDIAVQPDGKIVTVGRTYLPNTPAGYMDFQICRYNANGSLDSSFDGDGIRTIDFNGRDDMGGMAVVVQPDGKILAAVAVGVAPSQAGRMRPAVLRLNPDGTLDSSFDGDGLLFVDDFQVTGNPDQLSLALQPDGKILVGGWNNALRFPAAGFLIERFNPDGTADTTFGVNGVSFNSFDGGGWVNDLLVQPDGKIIAVGSGHGLMRPTLARYNPDGFFDTSFGTNGYYVVADTGTAIVSAALDTQGRIVCLGTQQLTRHLKD